jgi:hypothetical protein
VFFRKLRCGIEGKWKAGLEGVGWVPGVALFSHAGAGSMWIYGLVGWKVGFGAGLMRVPGVLDLRGDLGFHGLHSRWLVEENVGFGGIPPLSAVGLRLRMGHPDLRWDGAPRL